MCLFTQGNKALAPSIPKSRGAYSPMKNSIQAAKGKVGNTGRAIPGLMARSALMVGLSLLIVLNWGCVSILKTSSSEVSKEMDLKAEEPAITANADEGLIKAEIPEKEDYWPEKSATMNSEATNGRSWEDQKVKVAAISEAQKYPSLAKIRICYRAELDEWWVTMYDDMGDRIDVKTYIWNPDGERLERHLVLNTIPKGRLSVELAKQDPSDACEIIAPQTTR